jgi:hypothetical protein
MRPEKFSDVAAARAVVAEHEEGLVAWQFAEPMGNLAEGNVHAAGHPADLHLVVFADVEQGWAAGR